LIQMSREWRELQGLAPQTTAAGEMGQFSEKLAALEARLEAVRKARAEAQAAGGGAFVLGPSDEEEYLIGKLELGTQVRDILGEQQTAAERAGKAAKEAAQQGMLSVEDYNNVLQKLKPQLDQIWEKAKRDIETVDKAVAAGKQGIIGAPTPAQ